MLLMKCYYTMHEMRILDVVNLAGLYHTTCVAKLYPKSLSREGEMHNLKAFFEAKVLT